MPTVSFFAIGILSFYFLNRSLQGVPLGTAYRRVDRDRCPLAQRCSAVALYNERCGPHARVLLLVALIACSRRPQVRLRPLGPPIDDHFSPREIVSELDRYIVGQNDAKRAVAIALRNRWRRQQLQGDLKEEVLPKNILMIGPTGVGKTEISRRLAKLAGAPFLKVEATKFTEVGYVGRDVDSIIRDLVEVALALVRETQAQGGARAGREECRGARARRAGRRQRPRPATREAFRKRLRAGELNDKEIEIQVAETPARSLPTFDIPGGRASSACHQHQRHAGQGVRPAHQAAPRDRRRQPTTC